MTSDHSRLADAQTGESASPPLTEGSHHARGDGKRPVRFAPSPITVLFAVVVVVIAATNPTFRTTENLVNVLAQSAIIGVIALGQTIVLIGGGFDLSVGSTAALSGFVALTVFGDSDSSGMMSLGLLAGVVAAMVVGLFNGVLVSVVGINPLIATLGSLSLVRGLVLILSANELLYVTGANAASFTTIAFGKTLGVPNSAVVFVLLAVLVACWLRLTLFGQYTFAVGGNERAAELAGVAVRRVKVATYVMSGALAGVAGILLAARTGSALPNAGVNYELQSITAAVIGGTLLGGGKGSIGGTVIGVLVLGVLANALNLYGVEAFWQSGVTGFMLLLAVALVAVVNRGSARRG